MLSYLADIVPGSHFYQSPKEENAMQFLDWVGLHPILSVILLAVLVDGIVRINHLSRGAAKREPL